MDAPYVGEITTTTTKYAADGFFRQEASIDVDRFLIRMAMGGNKKLGSILDGKSESRIVYNAKDEEYAMETFDAIRENDGKPTLKSPMGRMNTIQMKKRKNPNTIVPFLNQWSVLLDLMHERSLQR